VATVTVVLVQREPDIRLLSESSHTKSIKQWIGLGFGSAVFMALYSLLHWYGLGRSMLRTHYWTTVVFAVLALAQYAVALFDLKSPLANFPVQNSTLGAARQLSLMYGFPRVSLTLVEPSILATYLLSGWAFWLYTLDRPTFFAERARGPFVWSGVVLGVALVISGSRMGYVVFSTLVLGALVVRPCRFRRAGLVGLSVLLGSLLAGPRQGQTLVGTLVPKTPSALGSKHAPSIFELVSKDFDEATRDIEIAAGTQDISVQQRVGSYLVALRVLRERPLLGAGFGTSGFYLEQYWPSLFVPLPTGRVAIYSMLSHYAAIAAETGLLGLLCLAVFAIAMTARLWRLGCCLNDERALAWGLGASVGGYAIGSAGTALVVYQVLLVWLLLALALAVSSNAVGDPLGSGPTAGLGGQVPH
jgi:O-antigen ligase